MSTLVTLPGWSTNETVFDPCLRHLPARIEVLSLPLFEREDPTASSGLDGRVEALASRAPSRCTVLGWSLGAQLALAWACAHPQQIERVILLGATPCFVQREGWRHGMSAEVFEAFAEALTADVSGTLLRFNALQAHADRFSKRVLQSLRDAARAHPAPSVATLHQGLSVLRESDLRPALRRLCQPLLLVHGAADRVVPPEAAEWCARAAPDARLAVLSAAAHAPFLSQPLTVARLIAEFCR